MQRVRPRIILDCDPGHDDAVAIITAAHHGELIGITTVHGNAPLERTTHNARVMRDLLDIDVPIHEGAARPLAIEPRHAANIHGESGLDGADLPAPHRPLDGDDAVTFIVETLRAATEPTWLVPVGPLTNIALALQADPTMTERLAGISLMGGGSFGNRTAVAEFNVWADPHAAAIVFASGAPLIMAGLDLTHQFVINDERIGDIEKIGGLLANTLAGLFRFFSSAYRSSHHGIEGAPLHDPCAVLALCNPDLFGGVDRHVAVETRGDLTAGQTIIDERDRIDVPPANCRVLTSIDAEQAWVEVRQAIEHFSHTR